MTNKNFLPYVDYQTLPANEMLEAAANFYTTMRRRRTVRHFSDRPVDRRVIEQCIAAAGTAPSGANQQPWHFVVVSDVGTKQRIREAAEAEEQQFYSGRAPQEWLNALAPLGTDANKPFLTIAPYLIAIFVQSQGIANDGNKVRHYYATESVGIATGILITGLHLSGLVSLTHTPSPMGFLNQILGRPANERPFLLLVTGYPAVDVQVPSITKKPLSEIVSFI